MRTTRRRPVWLLMVLMATALVVGACSSSSAPHNAHSSSADPAGSSGPGGSHSSGASSSSGAPSDATLAGLTSTSSAAWPRLTDSADGISFTLPRGSQHADRKNGAVQESTYTASVGAKSGLTVGVDRLGDPSVAQKVYANLGTVFKQQAIAAGADDFVLSQSPVSRYRGHAIRDLRLSFVPKESSDGSRPVWLIRTVLDGGDVVILQTIAFGPAAQLAAYRAVCGRLQHRLVDSLTFG